MKVFEMVATVTALLAANAQVAPFAPFIVNDGITDQESVIDAALEAKGACVAVFRPAGAEVDSASNNSAALANAGMSVVVYDQPSVSHSPSGDELLYHVIKALISGGEFQFQGYTLFEREKGGVACVADFTARVTFR